MARTRSAGAIARHEEAVARDGVRLSCRLSVPDAAAPMPWVTFVHGLGSGKDSPRNVVVAERLLDHEIATLLFDLSGHGDSTLDPTNGHEAFVRDLAAICARFRERPDLDPERMGVAGSSLGAVVALDATARGLISPAALVLRAPLIERGLLDGVGVPVLIIVGSRDLLHEQVLIAAAGRENVAVETIEGAGHLFEELGTLEAAVEKTARWFDDRLRR
jgi:putative phosphoribosyl transferase